MPQDREQLRQTCVDGLNKALSLGVLIHGDTRMLIAAAKGVLSVRHPAADDFLDAMLDLLPKGEI